MQLSYLQTVFLFRLNKDLFKGEHPDQKDYGDVLSNSLCVLRCIMVRS